MDIKNDIPDLLSHVRLALNARQEDMRYGIWLCLLLFSISYSWLELSLPAVSNIKYSERTLSGV